MKAVKYLRLETGTTGSAMAAAMGTTQPGYSAWENGKGTMAEHRREIALRILRDTFGYSALELDDLDTEASKLPKRKLRK